MDGLTITKVAEILKKRYAGSGITKLTLTEDSLCIGVYCKERASVMVRVTGGKPSVHTVFASEGMGDQFLDRLNGGTIADIGGRRYDRVIYFEVHKRRPSGKVEKHKLVFELIGKMANAFLVNEEGMITWTMCRNNADPDRLHGIGQTYQMPRTNKKDTLENYTCENFAEFLGFYPVTVKHAEKYLENNYSFAETAILINESLSDDKLYLDDHGRIIPFPPFGGGREISIDEIAGQTVAVSDKKRDESIRNRLVRYFEKQAEKYLKLKDQLEAELASAEKYSETARMAELLKSNLHKIKNAKGLVMLDEYTENGVERVPYEIPELFDVKAEMARLFKKTDKLKRSVPLLKTRIAEIDNIVDSALEQLYFTEISADDDELRELSAEMNKKSAKQQKKQAKEKSFEKIQIGGGTAYIGRNSVSNHRLVFQFANPSDWWFHAQKIPSAHLIFRKDSMPTEQEIAECASVVAGLSRARNDLKVTVDYTQKKHVKKPKNTPPGFVIYHRFFSVTVQPDVVEHKSTNGDTNG